ncbi:cell envelope integrity protein TolA [Nevskia soli]|uniref:cell envelope integrity protein TolA n=1 Tax=Nevskia soli TaxID=418856 RepID=UPI0004A77DEC|nr:cell envelope integrity protein TolA [Nevskia soli]
MSLPPRHLILAVLLHAVLFAFLLVGVQCTDHVEPTPVIQGVLIAPNDLKALKPPTPPSPTPTKPEDQDEGPQKIVKDTDVVADQAKEKQEKAAAEQKKIDDQKAQEQQQKAAEAAAQAEKQKAEAAKAEELKRQQEVQKQADEQAAAQKKQQEEAKRKADAAAQAAAEAQRKKELDEQVRKEAEQQQQAQAAAIARQKKAEDAQKEADRRKRAEELQKSLGVESAQLIAQVQNQWQLQLIAAIQQAWAWPPGTDPNTKAYLKIRLAPNGQVLSAEISTSSGVPLFDQTLKQAAYKASPLPLPSDPSAFDPNLTICFSPNTRSCQ